MMITRELRREGMAGDFVRLVQDARKADGLDITDRVALRWSTADPELAAALAEHQALISAEVLATDFGPRQPADDRNAQAGSAANPDPGADDDSAGEARAKVRRHEGADLNLTFWMRPI